MQGLKYAVVGVRQSRDAAQRLRGRVDSDFVMLQSLQLLQGTLGRELALGCMEPLSHDPVEDESDKADAGMGLDSLGQPMKHRPATG